MNETPYEESADDYDDVYEPVVDYAGDVTWLAEAFRRFATKPVHRLLDLGAGTGAHALRLARAGFAVEGVDLAPRMIERANAKLAREHADVQTRVRFHVSDMSEWQPDGPFDAVVSMFGAFCYLTDDARAGRALDLARERLATGGLLVFEYWNPLGYIPGVRWDKQETADGRSIVRLHSGSLDLATDVYHVGFETIVLRDKSVLARYSERHDLRMRTQAATRALLAAHGFETLAMTKGAREGKSFDEAPFNEFRVMAIARAK